MPEHRGDKFVWYVCLFITGALFGAWLTPEPRFAACTEIKAMPAPKPLTEKQKLRIALWFQNRDRGVILK